MVRDRRERGMEAGEGAGTTPIQSPLLESKTLTKKAGEGGAGEGGGAGAALTRSTVDIELRVTGLRPVDHWCGIDGVQRPPVLK